MSGKRDKLRLENEPDVFTSSFDKHPDCQILCMCWLTSPDLFVSLP